MKRIFIDASKCDGCLSCTLACMQAHRADAGTIYDLNLLDIRNESRSHIVRDSSGNYKPSSAVTVTSRNA